MIQTRNQYLQFMLVMLAAWALVGEPDLSWSRPFCFMDQEKTICSSVMVLF
ncbi:hypothetical protein NBY13_24885 (plasmid) [Escherichia coli]|nr:hypothetical protein [Escherichia coli]URV18519.1 hypothetical protein NBY13_24125 [Escherichia coli]URV18677.1 hypothetical protein NBY13_24885 [Escherichia coli]